MELKVICPCGQKYKFDVEPVNSQMPYAVTCPVCGVDGTGLANNLLLQTPAAPPPMPMTAASVATAAPVAAPAGGGLRISHAAPPVAPPSPPPVAAAAPARAAAPASGHTPAPAIPKYLQTNAKTQNNSLLVGTLGALLGAGLAVGLMCGFTAITGFRFPLTGTLMGAIIGFTARLMYRGTDSSLGGIAAAIAFVTIGGTLFFMFGLFSVLLSGFITMAVGVMLAFKIASG